MTLFYIGVLLYIAWLTYCQREDDGWQRLRETFREKYPERRKPDFDKELDVFEDNLKHANKYTGIIN